MKAVRALQTIRDGFTRRRALWITPFAFAGLIAISSRRNRRDEPAEEVTVVEFTDMSERRGLARMKRVVRSEAEWRKRLTATQFYVTRRQSTDTAFTGTYYERHDPGLYRCICCGSALFGSEAKFDSATGWPSFWAPVAEENIRTRTDARMFSWRCCRK